MAVTGLRVLAGQVTVQILLPFRCYEVYLQHALCYWIWYTISKCSKNTCKLHYKSLEYIPNSINHMKPNKHYSLQLCDYNSKADYTPGSVRCREGYQQCKGAATGTGNANNCYPADIWSDTRQGGDVYYMANLGNGNYGTNYYKDTLAFSVR